MALHGFVDILCLQKIPGVPKRGLQVSFCDFERLFGYVCP
jgi:hypothetical protein